MSVPAAVHGGLLLVDKPAGVTSFAVVDHVRRELVRAHPELAPRRRRGGGPRPPRYKCGHAGTLDPLATGLLLVLVGKGSRLSHFLLGLDKSYAATVRLGVATDSLDADGEVTATAPLPAGPEAVAAVLDRFRGEIDQVPPLVSALKRDGQPLYKLARSGKDVPAPAARPVRIASLALTAARWGADTADIDLHVACGSGTYIRSLARDVAEAAGTLGHVTALRRLTIGPFDVADAVAGVMDLDGAALASRLRPLEAALPHLPRLAVAADEAARIRLGGQPESAWLPRLDGAPYDAGDKGRLFRICGPDGGLVAVGCLDEETGAPRLAVGIPANAADDADADRTER
ncbi:tRNA pseudouridine(55) synthase TruB [bacterium]|nr:tRNA pseudouridine(55) synthase TruB [bacterium]